MYRKKNATSHEHTLTESVKRRLFDIIFEFSIVPGTDLNGEYHSDVFEEWINYCKTWGNENDRIDVVLNTIGRGLSYAQKLDNGLPDSYIMKELDKSSNSQMREGYYVGVLNQRGVVVLDTEGKPELELSKQNKTLSDTADSYGYTRYAETLKELSRHYAEEAKHHIEEHKKDVL
jgi:hypothetical protein